ncbi:MAG TPA: hypothetical protein VI636_12735 [Candidatus Angelobacter sp.]
MQCFKFTPFMAAAVVAVALAGCGGYNNSSSTTTTTNTGTTSGIKKRVLVSNEQIGNVAIVDGARDLLSTFTISTSGPSQMVTSGGFTGVINSNADLFSSIDNSKELVTESAITGDRVTDIAVSKDGKTVYGAVRNVASVVLLNTSTGTASQISVPSVSRLVISPNGTKLLAFVDDPNISAGGGFFVIDTASNAVTQITGTPAQLDQPFTAVFGNSETQAFILNCGAECGGTAASVVSVDFSTATPAFGTVVPVCGATSGLLNGSNLFVAGTPPTPPLGCPAGGSLQTVNTSSLSASTPIAITNGKHLKMQTASNNRLYVAAIACTPVNDASTGLVRGCLSIVNTSTSAVVFPEFSPVRGSFDVTGIQPISNRNIVYVCEGGFLDIYDTTTDKLTPTQVDIIGLAFDVVQIDP